MVEVYDSNEVKDVTVDTVVRKETVGMKLDKVIDLIRRHKRKIVGAIVGGGVVALALALGAGQTSSHDEDFDSENLTDVDESLDPFDVDVPFQELDTNVEAEATEA